MPRLPNWILKLPLQGKYKKPPFLLLQRLRDIQRRVESFKYITPALTNVYYKLCNADGSFKTKLSRRDKDNITTLWMIVYNLKYFGRVRYCPLKIKNK